jgi:hypothetical protein|tara:strand:+ start:7953 stop:8162 length:210 start_codon:yes stop_codon:yes gene_type:complete
MRTPREIRSYNVLRLIALSTSDPLAKSIALDELEEDVVRAQEELSQTCWDEDMDSLREAAERRFLREDT